MRYLLIALSILFFPLSAARADLSVGIGVPGINIGINMPAYPRLVPVPGYPVYYDPDVDANYFFYDGLYWVFQDGRWYASSWYDGPWRLVDPYDVPVFLLRIPVRYYRRPPVFFHGWRSDRPPHWGEHWGQRWEHRRGGWEHWDHRAAAARPPAALPGRISGRALPARAAGTLFDSLPTLSLSSAGAHHPATSRAGRPRQPGAGAAHAWRPQPGGPQPG